jgi:hypothetical protein
VPRGGLCSEDSEVSLKDRFEEAGLVDAARTDNLAQVRTPHTSH